MSGELHGSGSRPSSEHVKVTFGLFAENVNSAPVSSVVTSGPEWNVTIGASVGPTVHSHSSHWTLVCPAGEVASTANRWSPPARPEKFCGEVQLPSIWPSSQHLKAEPGTLDENSKCALVLSVTSSGPELIVTTGGSATVQVYRAGVASTLPATSMARTSSSCGPWSMSLKTSGDSQDE